MNPVPTEQVDERLLVGYADGDLGPVQRADIERYLDGHPELRALVDAYRRDLDRVRSGLAGSQELFLSASALNERAKDGPALTPPVHGGRTDSLPVDGEGRGGVSSTRSESLAESRTTRSLEADLIAGVKRRLHRQRVHRRMAYSAATVCVASVLAIAFWPADVTSPISAPASNAEAEARLAALNVRIDDLERQVAELETALAQRAFAGRELNLGALAEEEFAAIVYEAGQFYERGNRDIAVALSRYQEVVTRFPNTTSAASAEGRIRALTQTREDGRLES